MQRHILCFFYSLNSEFKEKVDRLEKNLHRKYGDEPLKRNKNYYRNISKKQILDEYTKRKKKLHAFGMSLLKLSVQSVSFATIFSILTSLLSQGVIYQERVHHAWQTINTADGQSHSGGRIQALEFLNSSSKTPGVRKITFACWKPCGVVKWKPTSLEGINLSKGYFNNINLAGAMLRDSNMQQAKIKNADLSGSNLVKANLEGAFVSDDSKFKNAKYFDNSFCSEEYKEWLKKEKYARVLSSTKFPKGFGDPILDHGMILDTSECKVKPETFIFREDLTPEEQKFYFDSQPSEVINLDEVHPEWAK